MDRYYKDLQSAVESIPRRDKVHVLGDLNARLDRRYCPYPASDTATDNGDKLADFLDDTGMFSAMCHMRKPRRQWFTHKGPKGFSLRIDHCLSRNNHGRNVHNCSLHSPPVPASDHRLLIVDTRLHLARPAPVNRTPMHNLAALIESAEAEAAEARVMEEAAPGSYPEFTAAARRAVELHVPLIEKSTRSKPWEDGEVSEKRKHIEIARQSLRSKPGDEPRQHLADAAKALADMYVDK
jgi:hypothetical protein